MNTTMEKRKTYVVSLAMAVIMVWAMMVSALAIGFEPYNADATSVSGRVSYSAQSFTVTVSAPPATQQIKVSATLYKKNIIGRTEIDSLSGSVYGHSFSKNKSTTIEDNKTYQIEVTTQVYANGEWDTIENTMTVKS